MKRFLIMAAAMLAFFSCTKEIEEINQEAKPDGSAFVAGQEVTIRCGEPQTKVSGTENADSTISFLWESGDKIKVTVGDKSSVFTLSSGAGTKTATFAGNMPASGTTFAIQYPETDPDLSTQTYSEGKLPAGKMKFTASDCTLDATANLTAAYAALRLNLYGREREITQITVTNTSVSPNKTCTLNCNDAVRIGSTESSATSFFVVLPEGTYQIKLHIVSNAISGAVGPTVPYESYGVGTLIATSDFVPSGVRTFAAGKITNMPVRSITTIWAPVNCGYEPYVNEVQKGYPYGKLYQWGRKYGQGYGKAEDGYEDEDYPDKAGGNQFLINSSTPQTSHPDGSSYNGNFYHDKTKTIINWYGGSNPGKLWNINEGTTNPVSKSTYDPCPTGWRVPILYELKGILGDTPGGASGWDDTNKGYWFNGSASPLVNSGIFFPAAGCINLYNGNGSDHGATGGYWASNRNGNSVWYLTFLGPSGASSGILSTEMLAYGFSVRCVEE